MSRISRRRRVSLQLAVGLTVSAAAVYFLVRQVDLRLVGAALAQADWSFLIAAVVMYFVALTLRAWRWTVLLRPVKRISVPQIWPVTVLGYAGNLVLPARLGEVLRAAVLRTRGVPMSAGLATIATERVIDGATGVALLLLTMRMLPQSAPAWLLRTGRVVGLFFAAGLLALWMMLAARPLMARILGHLTARFSILSRPATWALRFIDALEVLRSPSLLAGTLGITALAWAASVVEYWLAMRAMGVYLSPAAAAFSISAIGLSSAIPAAPGYVGTQELVGVAVLGLWGVPAVTGLAASLAFHAVEIIPIGVAGLIVGWREGVGFSPAAAATVSTEGTEGPSCPVAVGTSPRAANDESRR